MKSEFKFFRESKIFALVGLLAILIDLMVYFLLLGLTINPSTAKFFSYVLGGSFSYNANKNWTFKSKAKKYTILTFAISSLISLYINILVNKTCLSLSDIRNIKITLLSFSLATFSSAAINFLSLKFLVFNKGIK